MQQQDLDLATSHRPGEFLHAPVARLASYPVTPQHRLGIKENPAALPDVAGDMVENVDRNQGLKPVGSIGGSPSSDGQAAIAGAEFAGEFLDIFGGDTSGFRDTRGRIRRQPAGPFRSVGA